MKKTISLIVALLFTLVATSCGNKANAYLTDLEARVAKLEEAVQADDRAAYDEAEQAVNDFLAFTFAEGSKEAKAYSAIKYDEKFRADAVQTKLAALKDRANTAFVASYLNELEARVAALEEAVKTGDRAAYDEAEQAISDFLDFDFAEGSKEAKSYGAKFQEGEKFKSEEVQAKLAALKDHANETGASAPAQGEAEYELALTKDGKGVTITKYKGKSRHVVIPATMQGLPVVGVEKEAFKESKVTTAVFSEGLEVAHGFYCCETLETVVLPSTVKRIAERAFTATPLKAVNLPSSLVGIGDWAFAGCKNLTSVNFPSSLKGIGLEAFYGSGLENAVLPEGLEYLGSGAFSSCPNLVSLSLPKSLKFIGVHKYEIAKDCNKLENISIPEGLSVVCYSNGLNKYEIDTRDNYFLRPKKMETPITGTKIKENIALQQQIRTLTSALFYTDNYESRENIQRAREFVKVRQESMGK